MRLPLTLALVATAACTATDEPREPLSLASSADYASEVEPYVGLACGSLDCHGDPGRQLRLYGLYGLRLDAALRDQPTSADEVAASVTSWAAVSPTSAGAKHLAVLKPLATGAGGMAHVGDDVWTSTDEPGYRCVLAWLEGRSSEQAAQDACDSAFAELEPEP